jgi:phage terminase large subunit-like protein
LTSSALAVKRAPLPSGQQTPRVLHRPRFDSEDDARDAIDLMELCGQILDPWQCLLVCITLATWLGRLAASTVGALVARQNGKGGWLEAIAIWSLFEAHLTGRVFGSDSKRPGRKNFTLWTAHELKTSDEAYLRVKALIQANDDLAAEVVRWDGGLTGQHIIELRDGSRLAFLARSKSSGRGFSPRRVIFDESQEFSHLSHRAMLYATSAQGANRQLIYTGTVPSEENNSEVWTGIRDTGRKGTSKRAAWAEWTPKASDDPHAVIDPESWENRAAANPALGTDRLLHETIDAEWEAAQSDIDGFLRERLSVWPSLDTGTGVLDMRAWDDCRGDLVEPIGPVSLTVETQVDRQATAIILVGAGDDRVPQVRVAVQAPGVSWVPAVVADICDAHPEVKAVVLDGKSPAGPLEDDIADVLEVAGLDVELVVANTSDFAEACAQAEDAINERAIRHDGDPVLDAAVRGAVKQPMGDAEKWSRRKGGASVVALAGMSLGLWQYRRLAAMEYDLMDSVL